MEQKFISTIVIASEHIQLSRTGEEDLDFVLAAENDPENSKYVMVWPREKHIDTIQSDNYLHFIIHTKDSQKVGYIILAGLQNSHRSVELVRINIVDKGRGYGKEAIRLLTHFVFEKVNAHRLWLDVKEHNLRAKHVYESAGFQVEGMLRECMRTEDGYESLIIMGMLKHEYEYPSCRSFKIEYEGKRI
ncbi:GNAT family N-acetyltransferase [Paenibacillus alvei]|uniref:GNAT family N-acetyltransferase n=1 Tax=Paenibacillus alvei TaxID=44250 RepID=UPI0018CFD9C3|nr:GNAT family protein [Paenibacillus alvei]MBG9735447.1 acetyltransferase [Paenibacillus alvei]MBG9746823.1 acetyltransferase [Paenibacillus alvei]MCY9578619.1 GNAT family N-acetyltransferase [Paenibacillus alvei]MCY9584939.1 GNAT family N-acetyltransferase [Paenibacillus alvei]